MLEDFIWGRKLRPKIKSNRVRLAKLSENLTENEGDFLTQAQWPPAVETSIAVEDAVENRGLYRVFVSRLF